MAIDFNFSRVKGLIIMPSKTISVRFSKEDFKMLTYLCLALGTSGSRVIRDSLLHFYQQIQKREELNEENNERNSAEDLRMAIEIHSNES